tara:strand:+ start:150 stop:401 length:252 start_codon:yes stop_codon:yes gene_type:complete
MKNLNIRDFLLFVFIIFTTISCSKDEDNFDKTSRILIFRMTNDGILQTSSDGLSWRLNSSEKTKNSWNTVLESVKSKFKLISR